MKILCLIESLVSGGAERQMTGLASLLKREGHEVAVWTYYPKDFYRKQLDEAGVDYSCKIKAQNRLLRIPVLLKEAKRWKPDVLIAYLPTVTITACMMKMLGLKTKLIVSERNTSERFGLRERLRFFLFRKEADWVVSNSHTQEKFITEHYPSLMNKVQVITNYVDTEFFLPDNKEGQEDGVVRMICVASLFPQKNVSNFIDVVARLKNNGIKIKIDWFGRMDGSYAEECIQKVEEMNLSDMIEFRGVTHDIRGEYRSSDVFCLPSLREGFPNVLCEAMSCGLPVLCGRICDNAEIVQEGINGFLFDPYSVDDMVNTITRFVKLDGNTRYEMGRESRDFALSSFSSDRFVKKYMDMLGQVD